MKAKANGDPGLVVLTRISLLSQRNSSIQYPEAAFSSPSVSFLSSYSLTRRRSISSANRRLQSPSTARPGSKCTNSLMWTRRFVRTWPIHRTPDGRGWTAGRQQPSPLLRRLPQKWSMRRKGRISFPPSFLLRVSPWPSC